MKLLKINILEDYLKVADAYDNPKTLKIVESGSGAGIYWVKAITFPVTHQIEWRKGFGDQDALDASTTAINSLIAHNHFRGKVEDITTGPRM